MSIYDRARDALNAWTNGTEHEKTNAAIELAKNSDAFAAEVVRLHDEFAYLADDLDYEASDLRRNAPGVAEGIADLKSITAARIRAALEGVEE